MPLNNPEMEFLRFLSGGIMRVGTAPNTADVALKVRNPGGVPYFELAITPGADRTVVGPEGVSAIQHVLGALTGRNHATVTLQPRGQIPGTDTLAFDLPVDLDTTRLQAAIRVFCHDLMTNRSPNPAQAQLINNALRVAGLAAIATVPAAVPTSVTAPPPGAGALPGVAVPPPGAGALPGVAVLPPGAGALPGVAVPPPGAAVLPGAALPPGPAPLGWAEVLAINLMAGKSAPLPVTTAYGSSTAMLTLEFVPPTGDLRFHIGITPPPTSDASRDASLREATNHVTGKLYPALGLGAHPASPLVGNTTGGYTLSSADASDAAIQRRRAAIDGFLTRRIIPNGSSLPAGLFDEAARRFVTARTPTPAASTPVASTPAASTPAASTPAASAPAAPVPASTPTPPSSGIAGALSSTAITTPGVTASFDSVDLSDKPTWKKLKSVAKTLGNLTTLPVPAGGGDEVCELKLTGGVLPEDKVVINKSKNTMMAYNDSGYKAIASMLEPLKPTSSSAAGTIGVKFSHDTNDLDQLVNMAKAALDKGLAIEIEPKPARPPSVLPFNKTAFETKLNAAIPSATPAETYKDRMARLDAMLLAPERTRLGISSP